MTTNHTTTSLLRAPILAQIEVTQKCNHRCMHCYNFFRPTPSEIALAPEQMHFILDRLGTIGVLAITLTGGEPCENLSALYTTLKWIQGRKTLLSVNTNASLLDECLIADLVGRQVFFLISFPTSNRATFAQSSVRTAG